MDLYHRSISCKDKKLIIGDHVPTRHPYLSKLPNNKKIIWERKFTNFN